MTKEMHNSSIQFYSTVFCVLYMFRKNLAVHHQQHVIIYCITQYNRYNRAGESSCTAARLSYNKFYSTVFCLRYMFRTNLVVHHQQHGIIYCITQFGTIGTIVRASLAALKL